VGILKTRATESRHTRECDNLRGYGSQTAESRYKTVTMCLLLPPQLSLGCSLTPVPWIFQRVCNHCDDNRESFTIHPVLQLSQIVEECAPGYLLDARPRSMDRRLFESPSTGDHDHFYVLEVCFQYACGVHTTMLEIQQNLGTWYYMVLIPAKSSTS